MQPTADELAQRQRANLFAALAAFIHQRPGLEYGNYGSLASYRAELRSIGRDLREARLLLRAVELTSITTGELERAAREAYSGRLRLEFVGVCAVRVDYCTGQYFPTEYRRAVCAVMAQALWHHYRDSACAKYPTLTRGDAIRRYFRDWFGAGVQRRWFA